MSNFGKAKKHKIYPANRHVTTGQLITRASKNPSMTKPLSLNCGKTRRKNLTTPKLFAVSIISALLLTPYMAKAAESSPQVEAATAYQFLNSQITQSEAREAAAAVEQIILDIEANKGRYATELIEPLRILGKAQLAIEDYMQAIETFDRAIHLTRINYGLFDANQVALVYQQANAYAAMNDYRNAQQREEYAFQILANESTRTDILAGLLRLGDFYLESYNFLPARTRYRQGYELLQENALGTSTKAIPFLEGTAKSYRMERFPPYYSQDDRSRAFLQKPDNTRTLNDGTEYITLNNFPEGERALQKVIKIRQSAPSFSDENPDPEVLQQDQALVNAALLELGDWHLLFGSQKKANTLYKEVHRQQLEYPAELKIDFTSPTLLYIPKPTSLRPPPAEDRLPAETGSITLEFSVYPNGRIRGLKTIAFDPDKAIEFPARRSMRRAVYRPAYVESEAIITPEHRYVHSFQYFPSRRAREQKQTQERERINKALRQSEKQPELSKEEQTTDTGNS